MTRSRAHVPTLLLLFVLCWGIHASAQSSCKALTSTTEASAQAGSNYNLNSVLAQMREPSSDLVLVIAHRGSWRYCPENTAEAVYAALDSGIEAVEVDIRMSRDGVPFLSHDWDLRGELTSAIGSEANFYIYTLDASYLNGEPMKTRQGVPARDSAGNPIAFRSLSNVLTQYYNRLSLAGGISTVNGLATATRGATLILDIKGSDVSETSGSPLDTSDPGQFATFAAAYKTLVSWENTNSVDLTGAVVFKIGYNKLCDKFAPTCTTPLTPAAYLALFPSQLPQYNSELPNLIFIVYPQDVMNGSVPYSVSDMSLPFNQWRDVKESPNTGYLMTDYQNRYPGNSLTTFVQDDQSNGRGVAAFISNNTFAEGYRQSGGTCDPNGSMSTWDKPCGNQPLQSYASATIEYFAMPASYSRSGLLNASSITTDWFENAVSYLTQIGKHNTGHIN